MNVRPVTLREAQAFIQRTHRHHCPPRGARCALGLFAPALVGVATMGQPVARALPMQSIAEVTRVAVADDTKHGCSMLYGAAARVGKEEPADEGYEKVFLISRSPHYFYDAEAIAEPSVSDHSSGNLERKYRQDHGGLLGDARHQAHAVPWERRPTRNARDVWTIAASPYKGAHFAVMPPELVTRCMLAGSRIGDVVLDPFFGSGTVGMVAESLGRRWIGIELNGDYEPLIKERTAQRGLLAGSVG